MWNAIGVSEFNWKSVLTFDRHTNPIKMATRMPLMPPENETEVHFSRITREGKRISYKLSVMQQPERARACGAGAKCMPLPL